MNPRILTKVAFPFVASAIWLSSIAAGLIGGAMCLGACGCEMSAELESDACVATAAGCDPSNAQETSEIMERSDSVKGYFWRQGAQGASCTDTCKTYGASCAWLKLLDITTADKVNAVAMAAKGTSVSSCTETRNWSYSTNPGQCTAPTCCGGSCVGTCVYGTQKQPTCEASSPSYSRFCACYGDIPGDNKVSDYYGTNVPSYLGTPSGPFERFDPNLSFFGGLEGLIFAPTAEQGAGKFVFNRIWRSSKHITGKENYGHFHSWIQSYGNNSIEGGVGYNSAGGPHYYPQLHLGGIGTTYHPCNDLGAGHGLYYNVLGDNWLSSIQISNRVLHIPGSNVAFDKDQKPFEDDNGIWIGWGWTYLNLSHPKKYKYWMSFVESYDYQGPIVGYIPEHFNWVDPMPKKGDSYFDRKEKYEKDNKPFGTFADLGSKPNSIVSNEMYLWGAHVKNDIYYVPVPRVPSHKQREFVIANEQSITSNVMETYSEKLKANQGFNSLIPTSFLPFTRKFPTPSLKITETVGNIKHITVVEPPYTVGYDGYKGFVEWPAAGSGVVAQAKGEQNGYLYYRKLSGAWDIMNEDDHLYQSVLVPPPDNVQRVPKMNMSYHSYSERDTQNTEFANWDVTGMPRYTTLLQNGATATYVWFKFTEQPAFKTAQQHWPNIYTKSYLNTLQSYIERLQAKVAQVSKVNPSNPVFINYRKEKDGDFDPHLAKIDPGQIVTPPPGKRVGYVPVVISVYYPDDQSNNAKGGQKQKAPTLKCLNSAWTNTYHPYLNP